MTIQTQKAELFHSLHVKGDPVVLYNIWDPATAKIVEDAGAKALATGSAPVALSRGYVDGEQIPLDLVLTNVARIVSLTDLPVSFDFEGAYSREAKGIVENTLKALATGIAGFNFEDQIVGSSQLYDVTEQAKRIEAMKTAIDQSGSNAFLNARTDLFLKTDRSDHNEALLQQAIKRANAFKSAGADGFFIPNLVDESLIKTLCEEVDLPINIIALPGCPEKSILKDLGVARLSHGPVPFKKLMASFAEAAQAALN